MVHRSLLIVSLLSSVALAQLPFQTASCAWDYCAEQLCTGVPDFGECSCYNQSILIYACIADSCGDAFVDSDIVNQVSAFNACCAAWTSAVGPIETYSTIFLPNLAPSIQEATMVPLTALPACQAQVSGPAATSTPTGTNSAGTTSLSATPVTTITGSAVSTTAGQKSGAPREYVSIGMSFTLALLLFGIGVIQVL